MYNRGSHWKGGREGRCLEGSLEKGIDGLRRWWRCCPFDGHRGVVFGRVVLPRRGSVETDVLPCEQISLGREQCCLSKSKWNQNTGHKAWRWYEHRHRDVRFSTGQRIVTSSIHYALKCSHGVMYMATSLHGLIVLHHCHSVTCFWWDLWLTVKAH